MINIPPPPPFLSLEDFCDGYRYVLSKESHIVCKKKHEKYSDKWLNANYKWSATYYLWRMNRCIIKKWTWKKIRYDGN